MMFVVVMIVTYDEDDGNDGDDADGSNDDADNGGDDDDDDDDDHDVRIIKIRQTYSKCNVSESSLDRGRAKDVNESSKSTCITLFMSISIKLA